MRLTPVQNLRHLISKLHPPLPTSPRESKQLESLLRSSFKRRLDDVHPSPQADHSIGSPAISPRPVRSESAEATNTHLQAVLAHPLLGQRAVATDREGATLPELFNRWDKAVLRNEVDRRFIDTYVTAYQDHFRRSPENATKLATRIKDWFSTTSNNQKEMFLIEAGLIKRVIRIMYLGNLEEEVWNWLRLLYNGQLRLHNPKSLFDVRSSYWLNVEDDFVAQMIGQSLRAKDHSGAVQQYIQACIYRKESGRGIESKPRVFNQEQPSKSPYPPLAHSWKLLSSAVLRLRNKHGLSLTLYDQLLSWSPPPSSIHWFDSSFLHLYRPSTPSAQPLSQQIQNPKWVAAFASLRHKLLAKNTQFLLISIFDAAALELEAGRPASCKALLDFAEAQFPQFVSFQKEADPSDCLRYGREQIMNSSVLALALG